MSNEDKPTICVKCKWGRAKNHCYHCVEPQLLESVSRMDYVTGVFVMPISIPCHRINEAGNCKYYEEAIEDCLAFISRLAREIEDHINRGWRGNAEIRGAIKELQVVKAPNIHFSDQEKHVLVEREKQRSLKAIGVDLRLSGGRISQIHAKALRKIRGAIRKQGA